MSIFCCIFLFYSVTLQNVQLNSLFLCYLFPWLFVQIAVSWYIELYIIKPLACFVKCYILSFLYWNGIHGQQHWHVVVHFTVMQSWDCVTLMPHLSRASWSNTITADRQRKSGFSAQGFFSLCMIQWLRHWRLKSQTLLPGSASG